MIDLFPGWLPSLHPHNDRPDTIGNFKHKLLNQVGKNLKTLGLDKEYDQLKQRVDYLVKNAETAADARQLLRDVNNWIDEHKGFYRIPRVSEIRGLIDVGKGYANKLRGMAQRIDMKEVQESRTNLTDFVNELKDAEAKIMKSASALWDSTIQREESLTDILGKVGALTTSFEGLKTDLEDMALMEQALRRFQQGCARLANERLTWFEFDSFAKTWVNEMQEALGDEELPWDIEETISVLVVEKEKHREKMSQVWIDDLERSLNLLKAPTASEAERLYEKAANPPSYVTNRHCERASIFIKQIEAKIEDLKVDWLVKKFRELPDSAQIRFFSLVGHI